jgi:hypothetical protein
VVIDERTLDPEAVDPDRRPAVLDPDDEAVDVPGQRCLAQVDVARVLTRSLAYWIRSKTENIGM